MLKLFNVTVNFSLDIAVQNVQIIAAPPIAALWHHTNRLPASTTLRDVCHPTDTLLTAGPVALKHWAARIAGVDAAVVRDMLEVIWRAKRYECGLM
jgi:hypothetical protein